MHREARCTLLHDFAKIAIAIIAHVIALARSQAAAMEPSIAATGQKVAPVLIVGP